jgi:hypothetical protein
MRCRWQTSNYIQKAENLPVTGHLDAQTAGKLGVGRSRPEAISKPPAKMWEGAAVDEFWRKTGTGFPESTRRDDSFFLAFFVRP